jgi:hypothetical protein
MLLLKLFFIVAVDASGTVCIGVSLNIVPQKNRLKQGMLWVSNLIMNGIVVVVATDVFHSCSSGVWICLSWCLIKYHTAKEIIKTGTFWISHLIMNGIIVVVTDVNSAVL